MKRANGQVRRNVEKPTHRNTLEELPKLTNVSTPHWLVQRFPVVLQEDLGVDCAVTQFSKCTDWKASWISDIFCRFQKISDVF